MRYLLLTSFLLLPMTACMTQRDKTVWEEFKTEYVNKKAPDSDSKSEPAAAAPVEAPAG